MSSKSNESPGENNKKGGKMGKRDIITKDYMSKPHYFADAFNASVFGGKQLVKADALMLQEKDTTELGIILSKEQKEQKAVQKARDILKKSILMKDDKTTYLLLGIENQTDLHYALPVKNLVYDALNYMRQVNEIAERHKKKKDLKGAEFLSGFSKEDKIYPVITLAIYFGAEEWDAPRSLKEMFPSDIEEVVMNQVEDYRLHLIVPSEIKDFSLFKTDLGKLFKYIKMSDKSDGIKQMRMDKDFDQMSVDTIRLINEFTKSKIEIPEEKEEVKMCVAWDTFERECTEKGRAEGRLEGRREGVMSTLTGLVREGILSVQDAANRASMPLEEFEQLL